MEGLSLSGDSLRGFLSLGMQILVVVLIKSFYGYLLEVFSMISYMLSCFVCVVHPSNISIKNIVLLVLAIRFAKLLLLEARLPNKVAQTFSSENILAKPLASLYIR